MKKYCWKYTAYEADAQLIGQELELIESNNGEISSKKVLDYAESNKDSELHKCFEWDDTIAGRKYRLIQASNILTSISLEIKEEPSEVQKIYYSVVSSDSGSRNFKNIKDIISDDKEYRQLVDKARYDFESCKDKYNSLIKREDLKDIIFEIYKDV